MTNLTDSPESFEKIMERNRESIVRNVITLEAFAQSLNVARYNVRV